MTQDITFAARLLGSAAQSNVSIAPLTTYRLGGNASLFMEAQDKQMLYLARRAVVETGIATLVIGNGSNQLISDNGFDGLVITLGGEFSEIQITGTGSVRAGSAVSLPVLARRTVAEGLTGFEWAVGVPGSVGGAVRMNAGGHGSQMGESLSAVDYVDLNGARDGTVPADFLGLSYRRSNLEPQQVVTWAELELKPGDKAAGEAELSNIVKWRRENQPGGRNAGSVFTNPPDDSAGRLIESAGMKGYELGSASVSVKHANFIQSADGGTAADVLALIKVVRRAVLAKTGIALDPEVRLVGFTAAELEELA